MKKEIREIINLKNFVGIVLAILPVYLVRLVFSGGSLNFLEIMISIAVVWWILEKRFDNPEGKIFLKKNQTLFILIGVVLLGLVFSNFFNGNLRAGWGIIKGWFVFPLTLALLARDLFRDEKKRALKFFYGGAVGVAAVALLGYTFGQTTYDGRLQGFFNSPNYLAMYLVPAVIIGAVLFPENKKKYALSLVIISLAVYLTYSFTAWVALLIVLAGLTWLTGKNKKLLAGFLILVGLIFFLQIRTDKLNTLLNLNTRSSLNSRLMIWKSAGKIISDNPVWGIGPGNFQEKYLDYQRHFPPYLEWAVPHPHNLYLTFYLYAGIAGLLAFLLLIFFWLKKVSPMRKEKIALISLGIIIYFLLHGMLDTTYFKNDLAVIFWLAFFIPL